MTVEKTENVWVWGDVGRVGRRSREGLRHACGFKSVWDAWRTSVNPPNFCRYSNQTHCGHFFFLYHPPIQPLPHSFLFLSRPLIYMCVLVNGHTQQGIFFYYNFQFPQRIYHKAVHIGGTIYGILWPQRESTWTLWTYVHSFRNHNEWLLESLGPLPDLMIC